MYLIDIGNTNIKTYHDGEIRVQKADKNATFPKEKFYYICVNAHYHDSLKKMPQAINLEDFIDFETRYKGLGIDRKVVCKSFKNGVIVDAGSAITVDVMREGKHEGGFIMIGLRTFQQSFATISDALIYEIDEKIDLSQLPQNTKDALNFATFQSVICAIEKVRGDLPLLFCGGDGKRLMDFFDDASYHDSLVFEGMKEVIKESGC
jgi:type III pantothenate kinase